MCVEGTKERRRRGRVGREEREGEKNEGRKGGKKGEKRNECQSSLLERTKSSYLRRQKKQMKIKKIVPVLKQFRPDM